MQFSSPPPCGRGRGKKKRKSQSKKKKKKVLPQFKCRPSAVEGKRESQGGEGREKSRAGPRGWGCTLKSLPNQIKCTCSVATYLGMFAAKRRKNWEKNPYQTENSNRETAAPPCTTTPYVFGLGGPEEREKLKRGGT